MTVKLARFCPAVMFTRSWDGLYIMPITCCNMTCILYIYICWFSNCYFSLCFSEWAVETTYKPLKGKSELLTALLFSKQDVFRLYLPIANSRGWGAWCEAGTLCSSERSARQLRFFPVLRQDSRSGVFVKIASLPLLPVLVGSFYSLLWRSSSSSCQIFFRKKWSIHSCRIGVSGGRRWVQGLPLLPSWILSPLNVVSIVFFNFF